MVSCPPSLASLKTTISGSASTLTTAIKNSLSGDGSAENIGVAISRTATPNTPFVINSSTDTQRLVWSSGEISAGEVPLLATLVETANGQARPAILAVSLRLISPMNNWQQCGALI